MYHRRFKNRRGTRLFHLKGRFSLMHLGGGTFLYSFPGKDYPIVGKIEFGRKKYRVQGATVAAILSVFLGTMGVLSNAGKASSIDEYGVSDSLNGNLSPRELDEKSEELKSQILREGEGIAPPPGSSGAVNHVVRSGETLASLAARYRVTVEMIARESRISTRSALMQGQTVRVPNRPGLVYRVRIGDSVAGVADFYSVKISELIHDNPELADLDILEPGTPVFLPNAKIPPPPPLYVRPGWGYITSGYGMRIHPLYGYRQMHAGIDFAMSYGAVKASRAGRIHFAGYLGSYGNVVIIEHDAVFKTLYAHLSSISVRSGQYVEAGQVIAVSGNTGLSTGPHLHFELIRSGRSVNPWGLVRF